MRVFNFKSGAALQLRYGKFGALTMLQFGG
jgi:hypothetical protein